MKITHPDKLNLGIEVDIFPETLTIQLNLKGNLTTDGLTYPTLYSFLKECWINSPKLIQFLFPMEPIENENGNLHWKFINGWTIGNINGNGKSPGITLLKDGKLVSEEPIS